MAPERIIFLDIDGVLNSRRTPNPRKFPYIADPLLLERFRAAMDRAEAAAVLASTWRYDPAGLFSARHWGIPFIDITPDMPDQPRRDEILSWLNNHPEVHRLAVLDDEDDELDTLPLFQPSGATGLTEEIAGGLVSYLRGEIDRDMRRNGLLRRLQNIASALRGHKG